MRRVVISVLLGLAALGVIATSSIIATTEASTPAIQPLQAMSTISGVPTEALPQSGQCRIFFDNVPAEKQPAQMECEHAKWLAHSWGGRVVAVNGLTAEVVAEYKGRNDFTGVPVQALPPRGYCRAWLDGVPADQQPEASDCLQARRIAETQNGRVLFMPI